MVSVRNQNFKRLYSFLPEDIKSLARKCYKLCFVNHNHPSLHYEKFNLIYRKIRIGDHYRAMAKVDGDFIVWFWIRFTKNKITSCKL